VGHLFRSRFPYEVDMSGIIYNVLRMTTIHLGQDASTRVVDHYAKSPAFARAWARLLESDSWRRRDEVRELRRRDFDWFNDRFAIEAFA
jgi:hypothetical protein